MSLDLWFKYFVPNNEEKKQKFAEEQYPFFKTLGIKTKEITYYKRNKLEIYWDLYSTLMVGNEELGKLTFKTTTRMATEHTIFNSTCLTPQDKTKCHPHAPPSFRKGILNPKGYFVCMGEVFWDRMQNHDICNAHIISEQVANNRGSDGRRILRCNSIKKYTCEDCFCSITKKIYRRKIESFNKNMSKYENRKYKRLCEKCYKVYE